MNSDAWVRLGIPSLALLCAVLLTVGARVAAGRRGGLIAALGAAAWLGVTGALAGQGVLAQFTRRPPPLAPFMAACLILAVALGLSRAGARLADLPLWALVAAQAFRLPLELVMHHAAAIGTMPVQLSFSGYNFDIVVGAGALVLGAWLWLGRPPRALVVAWNLAGFATLGAIAVIAVLSSPFVRAFGDAAVNAWVAYFPYVWLPAGCVVFALFGHVVVARKLAR